MAADVYGMFRCLCEFFSSGMMHLIGSFSKISIAELGKSCAANNPV